MSGYAQLPRYVTEWEYFKNGNCLKVFIYLLTHAKYKAEDYGGYHFEAGDVRYTYPELESECGITREQAREVIRKLKATGILTVKTTPNFSVGSLVGWASQGYVPRKTTVKSTPKSTPSYNYINNKEQMSDEIRTDFGRRKRKYDDEH